ncbi:RICIN domain-containing protein [Streptomyces sp. NPDC001948]
MPDRGPRTQRAHRPRDRRAALLHRLPPTTRQTRKLSGQTYRIQWDHPSNGIGCLAVDDASTSPGALLAPRDRAESDSQKFRLEASSGGFLLRPLYSGLCIGFLPPVEDGAEAMQVACTGTPDQAFTFTSG